MGNKFSWAVNSGKVDRAIQTLKAEGKVVSESAVKELYIKFGGLVVNHLDDSPVAEVAKSESNNVVPMRRGRGRQVAEPVEAAKTE